MNKPFSNQRGFTLIEMLIVVIILGILAMIIIPQISVSTEDAKMNTLRTNLSQLRSVIEIYYHQHGSTYPGRKMETDGTTLTATDAAAATAFVAQLTLYTDANGKTQSSRDTTFRYGPYLKGNVPMNPYNEKNDVLCDFDEANITVKDSTGTDSGWKFYPVTGILVAGDNGAHNGL